MTCMGDKEQYKVVFSYMAGFLALVIGFGGFNMMVL